MNDYLIPRRLVKNCRIAVINSAVKEETTCDLLVLDEVHKYASETASHIFETVNYQMILCLTGTLERLDGKETLIKHYAPICDTITLTEAEKEGWVSPVKNYCVLLDVDLREYSQWNAKFIGAFATFDYNFDTAMKCLTDIDFRMKYARTLRMPLKELTATVMMWNKALKARKSFILSHPKKFEVAKRILEARADKKCITFSNTIADAESFKSGWVLHSKKSTKENQKAVAEFNAASSGVLHSSKACDQGLDVKGLSVGIIIASDSSTCRRTQRVGRICRLEKDKQAEMFNLVIKGTQDVKWFANGATTDYIIIDEAQLENVLEGRPVKPLRKELLTDYKYRY